MKFRELFFWYSIWAAMNKPVELNPWDTMIIALLVVENFLV